MSGAPLSAPGLSPADEASLDDPVRESLRGRHASLCRRAGGALGYDVEVATFVSVPSLPGREDWADLATLLGPGGFADFFTAEVVPPADWPSVFVLEGVQMIWPTAGTYPGGMSTIPGSSVEVVELGPSDVPQMLELVATTAPGPFWPRTREMGRFVGVREHGRLVAMAGERLQPPGWVEISSVCTAVDVRGRGLAGHLVAELCAGIISRGDRPFLHVVETNTAAIAVYERIGFVRRRRVTFHGARVPVV